MVQNGLVPDSILPRSPRVPFILRTHSHIAQPKCDQLDPRQHPQISNFSLLYHFSPQRPIHHCRRRRTNFQIRPATPRTVRHTPLIRASPLNTTPVSSQKKRYTSRSPIPPPLVPNSNPFSSSRLRAFAVKKPRRSRPYPLHPLILPARPHPHPTFPLTQPPFQRTIPRQTYSYIAGALVSPAETSARKNPLNRKRVMPPQGAKNHLTVLAKPCRNCRAWLFYSNWFNAGGAH